MRSLVLVGIVSSLAFGCGRDKAKTDGLPAGDKWAGNEGVAPLTKDTPMPSMGGGAMGGGGMGGNPHGGGGDPHAGMDMGQQGADPHAALGIDVGQGGGNPHGGGVDVAALGLPVPDPNRAIDPTRYIKGVITLGDKAKAKGGPKANTPIFVVVRKLDATGAPTGSPLAVDKLEWVNGDVVYELTEAKAMVGGTELTGDVIITARIDQDGDAISKQPGDITGSAHAKLPADNVRIVLDTVL